jgi:hypothetical protein
VNVEGIGPEQTGFRGHTTGGLMKKNHILCFLLLICSFVISACSSPSESPDAVKKDANPSAAAPEVSKREPLIKLMDQYLDALVKHDSSMVPLAKNVKLVENTVATPIGKGLWENTTGPGATEYKIYVADPVLDQIGYMGLLMEKGKPVQVAIRLKIVNGEITEIDPHDLEADR